METMRRIVYTLTCLAVAMAAWAQVKVESRISSMEMLVGE